MTILDIALVGVILSALVQGIKRYFGTKGTATKLVTVGLALVFGAGVYFFQDTAAWQDVLGVLAAASTVYAFLLK